MKVSPTYKEYMKPFSSSFIQVASPASSDLHSKDTHPRMGDDWATKAGKGTLRVGNPTQFESALEDEACRRRLEIGLTIFPRPMFYP